MKITVKYRIISFRDKWLGPMWKLQKRRLLWTGRWKTVDMTASPLALIEWIQKIGMKNLEIERYA